MSDVDPRPGEITRLLQEIEAGDISATERLLVAAHVRLRELANSLMRRERPDHTREPTARVHEAMLRLERQGALNRVGARNRTYLFGMMAQAIRFILVEHERSNVVKADVI